MNQARPRAGWEVHMNKHSQPSYRKKKKTNAAKLVCSCVEGWLRWLDEAINCSRICYVRCEAHPLMPSQPALHAHTVNPPSVDYPLTLFWTTNVFLGKCWGFFLPLRYVDKLSEWGSYNDAWCPRGKHIMNGEMNKCLQDVAWATTSIIRYTTLTALNLTVIIIFFLQSTEVKRKIQSPN